MDASIFSPDTQQTVTNDAGGLQSKLPGAFYQLPGRALKRLRLTWVGKSLTRDGHLEAALENLIELLCDNRDADYLGRAFTHLAWAVECEGHVDTVQLGAEDGFPYAALTRIAVVMDEGARKYARGNWRLIEYWSQVDHVLQHICALGAGDDSDDHIGHALTRCAFALEVEDPAYMFTGIDPVKPKTDEPCKECGQTDKGQTGEHPCPGCGLATLHDDPPEKCTHGQDSRAECFFCDAPPALRLLRPLAPGIVISDGVPDHGAKICTAIRNAMAQGDHGFLGDLTAAEWKAFTGGPMCHEFYRRDAADGSSVGDVVTSFEVGAYIVTPEFDGD